MRKQQHALFIQTTPSLIKLSPFVFSTKTNKLLSRSGQTLALSKPLLIVWQVILLRFYQKSIAFKYEISHTSLHDVRVSFSPKINRPTIKFYWKCEIIRYLHKTWYHPHDETANMWLTLQSILYYIFSYEWILLL